MAEGKVALSVRTVNPLGRFVTLYSGALSVVSIDLWFYTSIKRQLVSCRVFKKMGTYLLSVWLEWVETGNSVGLGVGVHSVENSVQDARVGSKSSSLNELVRV